MGYSWGPFLPRPGLRSCSPPCFGVPPPRGTALAPRRSIGLARGMPPFRLFRFAPTGIRLGAASRSRRGLHPIVGTPSGAPLLRCTFSCGRAGDHVADVALVRVRPPHFLRGATARQAVRPGPAPRHTSLVEGVASGGHVVKHVSHRTGLCDARVDPASVRVRRVAVAPSRSRSFRVVRWGSSRARTG